MILKSIITYFCIALINNNRRNLILRKNIDKKYDDKNKINLLFFHIYIDIELLQNAQNIIINKNHTQIR